MSMPDETKCCGGNGRMWAAIVAGVGACLIFVVLVGKMRQYSQTAPLGAERAAERAKALAELRAANADTLENVGWVDASKGIVRLPVTEAMKLWEAKSKDPVAARADLIAREAKASFVPPPPPSEFE